MAEQTVNDRERVTSENGETGVVARPRVDILETDQEILLVADLPGVKPADVDVRFENGELTVHGRRAPAHANKKRVLAEYEPVHYHRTFRLAEDVDAEKIQAELKNGVLKVRLPKAETIKPRRIAVKGE